jgi:hypothetical protein
MQSLSMGTLRAYHRGHRQVSKLYNKSAIIMRQFQQISPIFIILFIFGFAMAQEVKVDILKSFPDNAAVTGSHAYDSQVTLSIEHDDGSLTPAGWSTRLENGGDGRPFSFTPGVGLITGWTEGVLKMREGERAVLHVPSSKGYGASAQGSKGGAWYIPANSNLHFDIEILGKRGGNPAAKAEL